MKTSSILFALTLGCAAGLPAPSTSPALHHTEDVRAVLQVSGDSWKEGVSRALHYADKLGRAYERRGVRPEEQHLVLVYQGAAGYHLLDDAAFEAFAGERAERGPTNPNAERIRELHARGLRIEMCSSTMAQHGWTADDLLPEVVIVPNAYPRVIDLQMDGYAYLPFD